MLTDELIRGQAQHLIGALLSHNFVPKTLPEELYVKLWDVVMAQLKCVNHEGARAIESAACAERDARIAELTRELEEAREVLKETGLLLHHFWCDVQMNEYSFDKLNNGMEAIDAAIKEQT